jgi:hypothetical protein
LLQNGDETPKPTWGYWNRIIMANSRRTNRFVVGAALTGAVFLFWHASGNGGMKHAGSMLAGMGERGFIVS